MTGRLSSLLAPLAVAIVAAVGLAACGEDESTHFAEGERLWRNAVWNAQSASFRDALPHLEKAAEERGNALGRQLMFLLGSAYLFDGQYDRAVDYVDALRFGPPAPEPMLLDGWELALRHTRPDAEIALGHCLDRIAHDHPYAGEMAYLAFLWRGEERFFHADWDGVIGDLSAARELLHERTTQPNRQLVRMLCEAHRFRSQLRPAEALMRDAATRDPTYAPFAYDLGLLLAAQSKPDEARQWYLKAIDRDARFPSPHLKLARLAWDATDLDGMRRHLDRYAQLTNADAMAARDPRARAMSAEIAAGMGLYWTERAKLDSAEGRDDEAALAYGFAKNAYLRALDLNPTCHRALYQLIQIGMHTGEDEATIERWKKAMEELDVMEGVAPVVPAASDVGRTFC